MEKIGSVVRTLLSFCAEFRLCVRREGECEARARVQNEAEHEEVLKLTLFSPTIDLFSADRTAKLHTLRRIF